ncbi:MAG: hypothetical protein ACI30N_04650 [Muribaculaceae bacterium]
MKNIFKIAMLALVVAATSMTASAQKNDKNRNNDERRVSREQLAEKQAKYIAGELALDQAKTSKFVTTFCNQQKEIWAIGPRPRPQRSETEEQSKEAIEKSFDHSQKILDLRRKYYKEYSTFLTQKQIERVYELEKKMMKRFDRQKKAEMAREKSRIKGEKSRLKGEKKRMKAAKKRMERQQRHLRSCPADSTSSATPMTAVQG